MGFAKEKALEDEERGAGFVGELIDGGYLEGAALGVAKRWVDGGDAALSDKQMLVLKQFVFGPYVAESCTDCANSIPWSEMLAAYENGGHCSWCEHRREKALAE